MVGISHTVVQIQASDPNIIAPCGINCSLCRAFLRDRKPCPGCRSGESNKSNDCLTCVIKNCKELAASRHPFCSLCAKYPCAELRHLDARYQTRYAVSIIENLARVQAIGVERFLAEEATRWSCPKCGSHLCMHRPLCINCGHLWQVGGEPCICEATPNSALKLVPVGRWTLRDQAAPCA